MLLIRALLLTVAAVISTINIVEACSCMPDHPQGHACRAKFVVLARIVSGKPVKDPAIPHAHYIGYKIKILKTFKSDPEADKALKHRFLHTPRDDSLCGVKPQLKQLYLIAGTVNNDRAYINLCHFMKPWNSLTLIQRKGFRTEYYKNCNCQIRPCWGDSNCPTRNPEGCGWSTFGYTSNNKDCQEKHSVCTKHQDGNCDWSVNRYMNHCMTKTRGWQFINHRRHNEATEP